MAYAQTKPAVELLRASLRLRADPSEANRAVFVKLIASLRATLGPDAWIQALFTLDGIARMARGAGDWELARIATQNMLDHDPEYAAGHYAAALLAEHQGDKAKTKAALERARQLWGKADSDFPEMINIQQRLATAQ